MADQEKKMTKYDLKQQRRQEEKKDNGGIKLFGFACVAFLVFCIGVFGFQTYQNQKLKNETYVMIGEHEVKAEYDYYFYSGLNAMYSYYGTYLSYMGLDLSQDLSTQYYTETMTWQDYFDEQAVLQLQQVYALADEAAANGFEYDAAADVDTFVADIEAAAESVGYTTADYVKASYGNFASMKEVKSFVERDSVVSAYYDSVYDGIEITDEEITTYYEENKDSYDSVDYLVCQIDANIPEEETEAVEEETAETNAAETETEEETLSEEEQAELEAAEQAIIDEAMAEAEALANEMLGKVTDEAAFEELAMGYSLDPEAEVRKENVKKSSITPTTVATWLFDSARQAGDKTVIANEASNCYYVVYFLDRYLDESKTVDVRHILIPFETVETTEDMTEEEITAAEEAAKETALATAEEIYEGWLDTDATEEGFAALANEHSTDTGSNTTGGLYEAVAKGEMVEAFNDWIFDDARKAGDSDIVETEYGYHIMYYVADNEIAWKLDVDAVLRSNKMNEDVTALMETYEVVDENKNIPYLHVEETVAETVADTAAETTVETETESAEETTSETEAE